MSCHHFSLSFIASGRSSGLHPVSWQSCCMYVRAGRLAFARPYMGVHRSISLMSGSLLLQQCPACLVRLTWIVFMMGGRWPYSWCFVRCCLQILKFPICNIFLTKYRITFFFLFSYFYLYEFSCTFSIAFSFNPIKNVKDQWGSSETIFIFQKVFLFVSKHVRI